MFELDILFYPLRGKPFLKQQMKIPRYDHYALSIQTDLNNKSQFIYRFFFFFSI